MLPCFRYADCRAIDAAAFSPLRFMRDAAPLF